MPWAKEKDIKHSHLFCCILYHFLPIMEWDPWFSQGDWELHDLVTIPQTTLLSRKLKSKRFAQYRSNTRKKHIAFNTKMIEREITPN